MAMVDLPSKWWAFYWLIFYSYIVERKMGHLYMVRYQRVTSGEQLGVACTLAWHSQSNRNSPTHWERHSNVHSESRKQKAVH